MNVQQDCLHKSSTTNSKIFQFRACKWSLGAIVSRKLKPSLQPPMFDAICTFPLASDLFAQCIHPRSPLLALGLASGHVQLNRLPPSDGSEARNGSIESAWRTRRHKGSCRSLCFSHDGEYVFSAGTDGLVKVGTTETGQVVSKIAIPQHK